VLTRERGQPHVLGCEATGASVENLDCDPASFNTRPLARDLKRLMALYLSRTQPGEGELECRLLLLV
jgi:hypothetical protein